MDVSKLCINSEDVANGNQTSSVKRTSLPLMTELLPHNNNNNDNNVYQDNPQCEYQQRYISQHRHLKNYSIKQQQQSEEVYSYYYQHQDMSNQYHQQSPQQHQSPQHHSPQHHSPQHHSPQHHSPQHHSPQHHSPIHHSPLPPISTPSTASIEESSNDNNNHSFILNQLLDQCSMIYSRIGKYRVDPLTATERSHIIDQVYYTAETMLKSINELHKTQLPNEQSQQQQQQQYKNETIDLNSTNNIDESSPTTSAMNIDNNVDEQASDEYKTIRQARNLQDNAAIRPKYRRRSKRSMIGQRCHSCNTTETPEWRRGPDGARTLCNACGLHYSKLLRKGSMTVQTHNYILESPPEFKRAPRIIQFPIVQVNASGTNNTKQVPPTTTSSSSSSSISTPYNNNMDTNNSRITEIHESNDTYAIDEEMNDNLNKDVG